LRDKKVGLRAVLSLLNHFSISTFELSLSDISKASGYPISSTSRYLKALESEGFVKRDKRTKKYSLGYKIYRLFYIINNSSILHKVALRYMQEVSNKNNEVVTLFVEFNNSGVYIERIYNDDSRISHVPPIGVEEPLYMGSRKVLLAFLPENQIREVIAKGFKKYTNNTITDPDILFKELQKIREQGYAISNGEKTPGVKSIAVPIWHNNSVIAGLSISGPQARITKDKEQSFINQIIQASSSISRKLDILFS